MPGVGTGLFSYSGSGGLIGGGSGSLGLNQSATGSGGLVASGQASISGLAYSYTPTGGIVTGGGNPSSTGYVFASSGGLIGGGASVASQGFTGSTGTGGLVGGGSSVASQGLTFAGSGGLIGGGSQVASQGSPVTPTGGLVGSGSSSLAATYGITAVAGAGLQARGTAGTNRSTPTGYLSIGAVQPGSAKGTSTSYTSIGAVQPAIFGATGSGGLVSGGTATASASLTIFPTGGLVGGGSATGQPRFTLAPAGGLVAGGSGGLQGVYSYTPTGGIVTGGSSGAGVPGFRPTTGTGSLIGGGSASTLPKFGYVVSTGGLIAGGAASQAFTDLSPGYHVWQGAADGSPIDYTATPILVRALSWTSDMLPNSSTTRFAVRAYDPATGYDDGNLDATVIVTLDNVGHDITDIPLAPTALSASPGPAGAATARWAYLTPPGATKAPTAFLVWLTRGNSVDYTVSPAATVTYVPGLTHYAASLAGLSDGVLYSVGVRATNATGTEANTLLATVTGSTTGPNPPDDLTGVGI